MKRKEFESKFEKTIKLIDLVTLCSSVTDPNDKTNRRCLGNVSFIAKSVLKRKK